VSAEVVVKRESTGVHRKFVQSQPDKITTLKGKNMPHVFNWRKKVDNSKTRKKKGGKGTKESVLPKSSVLWLRKPPDNEKRGKKSLKKRDKGEGKECCLESPLLFEREVWIGFFCARKQKKRPLGTAGRGASG